MMVKSPCRHQSPGFFFTCPGKHHPKEPGLGAIDRPSPRRHGIPDTSWMLHTGSYWLSWFIMVYNGLQGFIMVYKGL